MKPHRFWIFVIVLAICSPSIARADLGQSSGGCSAIVAPVAGTPCWDSTANTLQYYDGSVWRAPFLSTNGEINVMDRPYNAVCDGTTDDTTAIQAVITAVKAATVPKTIRIPDGKICVVTQLNLTNTTGKLRIVGGSAIEGTQSTIRCIEASDNSGVCLDFSGSNQATVEHLTIDANTATSPKFAMAFARDNTDLGYSDVFSLDHVTITAKYTPLLTYGGEVLNGINDFLFSFNTHALVVAAVNGVGFSSPFVATKTGPVSMTSVHFKESHIQSAAASQSAILIDNAASTVSDVSFEGGWTTVNSSGGGLLTDTGGLFRDWSIRGIREEGEGASTTAYYVKLSGQAENFTIDDDTFSILGSGGGPVQPTVPSIQFNNAGVTSAVGGYINLRPGDGQAQYPTTVLSCVAAKSLIVMPVDLAGGAAWGISCPGSVDFYSGVLHTN